MTITKNTFLLDPSVTFLNHGSFGAVPKPVFKCYQFWQRELERQPVEFLGRRAPQLLENARKVLGGFIGAPYRNIVFTTNVTEAINVVVRSLSLKPGDEVLASDMEYGAMDRTWRFYALKYGFKYINHPVTVPVTDPQAYVDQLWSAVTQKTRVIFISHISSPTALIAPVKEICQLARQAGILTVIDGAHAPGQIDVNLVELDADFYGANLHKWLCAPKGAGFLYANPRVQHLVEPLIVSWGWQSENPSDSQFIDYLQWTGTRDLASFLSVPAAIEFQQSHHWSEVQKSCHALAAQVLDRISNLTALPSLYASTSNWFAQMVACPLPAEIDPPAFQSRLYNEFKIEVPVLKWNNHNLIRVSMQVYNSEKDIAKLLSALKKIL